MYEYTTFEEDSRKKKIRGRVLSVLEFDKVIEKAVKYAVTSMGKELVTDLVPTTDGATVAQSLNDTYEAFVYINKYGKLPLGGFMDLRPFISYAQAGGSLSVKDFVDIRSFINSIERIKLIVSGEHQDMFDTNLFTGIRSLEVPDRLKRDIDLCVTPEGDIDDRASDTLYSIRREIKDISRNIRVILERIIRSHEEDLQESIITIRDERFCIPLKAECKSKVPGIIHDTSSSGHTIFVEPMPVVETNNRIRELKSAEMEEIERILEMLTKKVLSNREVLTVDLGIISEIDFNSAKAQLAIEMDATKPELNDKGKVNLIQARHPLIDKDRVVPVDIINGIDYKTLIITGPNTGGKTVSLKTCGLLTLMTMAGLMIPVAPNSGISVFDRVLADIGDEQSIEQSLSTFSAHMSNVVFILKNVRGNSLVLLDELGSGTDPVEGAALAMSILDELRSKNCVTMATTHYKELKAYAVETEGVMNASCEFNTETLSPTYRLIIGMPGVSNAFVISGKLGLPKRILEKAQGMLSQEEMAFERLLEEYETNNRKVKQLLDDNEILNKRLKEQEQNLIDEKKKLKESKTRILNDARAEQKELLKEKEEELTELIKSLKKSSAKNNSQSTQDELDKVRRRLRAGIKDLASDDDDLIALNTSLPGEVPNEIVIGEQYRIPHLDLIGKALTKANKSGKVQIEASGMKLTVEVSQLRLPTAQDKEKDKADKAKANASKPKKVSSETELRVRKSMETVSEIVLLGKRYDEAQSVLDRYIDDCVLSHRKIIRIVHGKGTGALRNAVDEFLRGDSRVRTFRLGTFGEGDDGVTIAELY
ncbi:MAG: endonuclease MutS2 [Clostridia bacterium]|nr:endonuclease MutS2 [Clostridia bacterium]